MMRVKPVPDVKFGLVFRCETLSVPVMRRVLGDTLRGLGVDEESVYDILLAATEACTNVLTHGGRQVRGYAVVTSLGAVGCQVEVADDGAAWRRGDAAERDAEPAGDARSPSCPSRAAAWPSCGPAWTTSPWTAVPGTARSSTMRKHISWSTDAPLRQLRAAVSGRHISFLRADRGHYFPWVS